MREQSLVFRVTRFLCCFMLNNLHIHTHSFPLISLRKFSVAIISKHFLMLKLNIFKGAFWIFTSLRVVQIMSIIIHIFQHKVYTLHLLEKKHKTKISLPENLFWKTPNIRCNILSKVSLSNQTRGVI